MKLPFVLDGGAAADAGLGLVVLRNDETLEPELRTIFKDGAVALYHT